MPKFVVVYEEAGCCLQSCLGAAVLTCWHLARAQAPGLKLGLTFLQYSHRMTVACTSTLLSR